MAFPLAGLKVLDFSRVVAGPFATRMLADLVVENYRPGVMARFGLDYNACAQVNPDVIYLSISGFGQTSSWRDRPAYAPIIHAETGLLDRQSQADQAPPTNPVLSIADTNAALHGLVGLLSALWMREQTGTGQHIDLSMMAAMTATDDYAHWALDNVPFRPLGGLVWATGYGHIMISGDLRSTWYQLHTAGIVEDGLDSDASVAEKITARQSAISDWFGQFSEQSTLEAELDSLNVAWGSIQSATGVFDTAIAKELGLSVEVEFPSGPRRVAQSPYRFSDAESGVRFRSPYRGEHNGEVLEDWLGYSKAEVDSLVADEVLLATELPGEPSDYP